ncbi:MAG: hypothetical protein MHPSP_002505 [Paramarteilia canceri]
MSQDNTLSSPLISNSETPSRTDHQKCRKAKWAMCTINQPKSNPLDKWLDQRKNDYNLVALIRINRHCTRQPTKPFSKYESIQNLFTANSAFYIFFSEFLKDYSDDIRGKLTMSGRKESFDLGVYFRKYYENYLSEMDKQYVLAGCSGIERACTTRTKFIEGLYGKHSSTNSRIENKIIDQTHIPTLNVNNFEEYLALKAEFDAIFESEISPLIKSYLKDDISIDYADFMQLVNAAILEFVIKGDRFWVNILNSEIKDKLNYLKERAVFFYQNSLIFYFSHDTTMTALIKALKLNCAYKDGITDMPFCSNIQLNLVRNTKDNEKISIIASYNENICNLKDFCGDGANELCDIDLFIEKMREITGYKE